MSTRKIGELQCSKSTRNTLLMTKEFIMKIEDMFEFINPTAIRIKGTRVGIETGY